MANRVEKQAKDSSLAELRGAPGQPPPVQLTELEAFFRLPLLGKLITAYQFTRNQDGSCPTAMKQIALKETIKLSAESREKLGVQVVACVPLDDQGKLFVRPITTYPIYVVFPFYNGRRYLATSRLALSDVFSQPGEEISRGALRYIDTFVSTQAVLIPENKCDGYNRLCQEVKMADSLIKQEKSIALVEHHRLQGVRLRDAITTTSRTGLMDKWNRLKHWKILECLVRTQDLIDKHLGSKALYALSSGTFDGLHRTLQFQQVRSGLILSRLVEPTRVFPFAISSVMISTMINTQVIRAAKGRYLQGNAKEGDPQDYGIAVILGL